MGKEAKNARASVLSGGFYLLVVKNWHSLAAASAGRIIEGRGAAPGTILPISRLRHSPRKTWPAEEQRHRAPRLQAPPPVPLLLWPDLQKCFPEE
jgi:hypothetical protein